MRLRLMGKWRRNLSKPRRWQKNHLIAKYGAICYLCGEMFKKSKDITIDHWIPLSKGGEDNVTNYRLACKICNKIKADMTPEQFREFQSGEIKYE